MIQSLTNRVRHRFPVAIAEVDDLDSWRDASIGIACVSTSAQHANQVLTRVVSFVEDSHYDLEVLDYEIELIQAF